MGLGICLRFCTCSRFCKLHKTIASTRAGWNISYDLVRHDFSGNRSLRNRFLIDELLLQTSVYIVENPLSRVRAFLWLCKQGAHTALLMRWAGCPATHMGRARVNVSTDASHAAIHVRMRALRIPSTGSRKGLTSGRTRGVHQNGAQCTDAVMGS